MKAEDRFQIDDSSRIKFVETSGRQFGDFFKSSNVSAEKCSPTGSCFACDSNDANIDCKTTNIGYSIICKKCTTGNRIVSYEGESARNAHLRGNEHRKQYCTKNKNSVLYRHVQAVHKGEEQEVSFKMKVVGRFNSALARQIEESLRLRNKDQSTLLNSKSEFYGPVIKRKVYE